MPMVHVGGRIGSGFKLTGQSFGFDLSCDYHVRNGEVKVAKKIELTKARLHDCNS